jgi:Xaa-Pro dipeptidase
MAEAIDLEKIQEALRAARLDGWLFYDHHHRDAIAYRVLKIQPPMCTRRWYYLVPAQGEPAKLVHRIERHNLDGLPGTERVYSSWSEQRELLQALLDGNKRIAMQYSPLNDIPYVGLVDAGTVELVRSCGVEVVSSADLVQLFEARWTEEALASHLQAGKIIHAAVRAAFAMIGEAVRKGEALSEYEVQQEIVRHFTAGHLDSGESPIVAVNANSANPHYTPTPATSLPIRARDFVLLDVSGKLAQPGSVYFDITWTGYVGEEVPHDYAAIFNIVREARDTAIDRVKQAMRAGRELRGYEVDDAARQVIRQVGYESHFVHRTGHSLGEEVHGNGANMDNYETRDTRRIVPGTCFTIEPGIYLDEFGVRSEVNVYVEEHDVRVTGEVQEAIVPVMAGE